LVSLKFINKSWVSLNKYSRYQKWINEIEFYVPVSKTKGVRMFECAPRKYEMRTGILYVCEIYVIITMLCGSLSPRHDASSGSGRRRRPPDMEGSWE
jgi:hypothetical protein